ncbi:MAG: putative peptide modification system cyclase [Arenimonas sp.]
MATNPFTPSKSTDQPTVSSVLRTVLLCDWADSTKLIETLGDARAVGLMQKHDQFVRDTLSLTHGRLIDKSDGILALFERPIQALDFALRYQQQMRLWGAEYQQAIQARIGIHVGDVMTWENAPDQIAAGAKPLEVEGFAKPVAARLMGLAMPGQILLSGMAQSLAQRAQLELGERGQKLRWILHGRYTFKGVPAPMLVHEVGDPEFSPLRAPASTQKAWREIPLWRRPPVLALEVLLTTGLIGGFIWSTFQSPPAIAFYERDWIVMGDLQNLTREKMFDDSLDTALRIGLEQSAYVNVISDSQEDEALKRMQREGQGIDRQVGTELALREGAKALVLPTLTESGGHLRISAEVIDPNSGVTVYTESAEATNGGNVLPALDHVLEKLRKRLGEPINLVDQSKPLQQVTTPSMEALRAYTLGQEAKKNGSLIEARNLNTTALSLDKDFALAYIALGSLDYIENDLINAQKNWSIAETKRSRLSLREIMWLDATSSVLSPPKTMLPKWKALVAMYPDEYLAYYNYAYFSLSDNLDYQNGLDFLTPAYATQNPNRSAAYYLRGVLNLAVNKPNEAKKAFEQSQTLSASSYSIDHAAVYAVDRNYSEALKILGQQDSSSTKAPSLYQNQARLMYSLDQGRWQEAIAKANEIQDIAKTESPELLLNFRRMELAIRSYYPDSNFTADLKAYIDDINRKLNQDSLVPRTNELFNLMVAGIMAARHNDIETASTILRQVKNEVQQSEQPKLISMSTCLESEILLGQGNVKKALLILNTHIQQGKELYYSHALRSRALMAAGQNKLALQEAEWLVAYRGRAYIELNNQSLWDPSTIIESNLAILDAATIEKRLGRFDQAERRNKVFLTVWPEREAQNIANQQTKTR